MSAVPLHRAHPQPRCGWALRRRGTAHDDPDADRGGRPGRSLRPSPRLGIGFGLCPLGHRPVMGGAVLGIAQQGVGGQNALEVFVRRRIGGPGACAGVGMVFTQQPPVSTGDFGLGRRRGQSQHLIRIPIGGRHFVSFLRCAGEEVVPGIEVPEPPERASPTRTKGPPAFLILVNVTGGHCPARNSRRRPSATNGRAPRSIRHNHHGLLSGARSAPSCGPFR